MGKKRFQREKESSVTATVGEASSLLGSQTARRRRGRPRKNLEGPENSKKEEDEDYEEYEYEEEEDDEQVEIVNREKLKKKKVRSSPSVEEGQKWKREEVAEEEEKPDMTVKTVAPLSYRRSRRKNTPVKSWSYL
ncbi:protein FAM50A isoform X2 [Brassica rapa]|uniref:protein FAM50A isoform X2 n=1 Tax=Brassica campestris TaxID=3711 RepID=UPI00142E64B7|nr:protein FAM50A isoform X2 [Brassica rapa]